MPHLQTREHANPANFYLNHFKAAKLIREAEIPYVLPPETAEDFFAEDVPSDELLEKTSKVVIYRWNRHYPSDLRWEPDLNALGFVRKETADFPGTSHENITREVYER